MIRKVVLQALVAFAALPFALAQANSFDVVAGKRSIGHDTYTLKKTKSGYQLSSRIGTKLNGNDTDMGDEFKYDEAYLYVEGGSTDVANQGHTSYNPNKARTQLTIGTSSGSVQEAHQLAVKPAFTLLPMYDAGAAQAFLLHALTHPTADNLYSIVVPHQGAGGAPVDPEGGSAGPAAGSGNSAFDALFTKGPDATGTLDGKPVTLHTFTLTAGKSTWVFYADETNLLMQLDSSMARASCIRVKFKLDAAS